MPSSFLLALYDPAIAVGDETPNALRDEEYDRLILLLSVATAAAAIPRRLGADASSDELADDKKRCKRIAHVARQCLVAMGHSNAQPRSLSKEAAQVRWEVWWERQQATLLDRQKYIACWALVHEADSAWAKSAIVRLQNELSWLAYAMR